jgi:acyl-CoA thioester hydrolase
LSEVRQVFEMAIAVAPPDIDGLGHVNNVVYVRWVQDIAVAHWRAVASAADQERFLWIVVRHEIDYKQAARLGDTILARTWVGAATRIRFERHTELLRASDKALLAKARTVWCPVDAVTGKLASVSAEVRARFSVAEGAL